MSTPAPTPDRAVSRLQSGRALVPAVTTPIDAELRPDGQRLLQRCRALSAEGCDGIALFGTTGEGVNFAVADRQRVLEQMTADGSGIDAACLIVAAGASSSADAIALAKHATGLGVAGVLLMAPTYYRNGIGDEGLYRFYASVIDRVGDDRLRLYLYHFPDICGSRITPALARRLRDRYGPIVAGIKDSGGDLSVTLALLDENPGLAIYTGTEVHIPDVVRRGGRGSICGLGNVLPRLLRRLLDARDQEESGRLAAHVLALDTILSRGPFIASVKAMVAAGAADPAWLAMMPPLTELAEADRQRMLADIAAVQAALPADLREAPFRG